MAVEIDGFEKREQDDAVAAVAAGEDVVIRFFDPVPSVVLDDVNALAQRAPGRLTVHIYGQYAFTPFDARLLEHLPDVARFSVRSLHGERDEDRPAGAAGLTHLSIDIWGVRDKALLHRFDGQRIRRLTIEQMKSEQLDLAPLAQFKALESVVLSNSVRNHDALRGLPNLRKVHLRPRAADCYDWLSDCPALSDLKIILGGAPDLTRIRSQTLRHLEITRCRGLEDLGPLHRFPALETLEITDQLRLSRLDLRGLPNLRRLWLYNCKTLKELDGIEAMDNLRDLRIGGTALDLDALEALPQRLETLHLFGFSNRENDVRNDRLKASGLGMASWENDL